MGVFLQLLAKHLIYLENEKEVQVEVLNFIKLAKSHHKFRKGRMSCPCGLTRAELDAHGWVSEKGRCQAPYEDANGEEKIGCGKLYASHPSAGKYPSFLRPPFFHPTFLNALLLFLLP
jgi:hypothetical protein